MTTSSASTSIPAAPNERVLSPEQTLRRLFLTLFLRGRSSRGLKPQHAPKSVGQKLALTLALYTLIGLLSLMFWGQSVFALAVYLHGMTFVFLGMFVASSSGEILFNPQEADILLHRPIDSQALLRAKVRVLIEVSLWLAGAFNLVGLVVGFASPHGGWLFPCAHAVSTTFEALFCTGCVVMIYQLCLRWFGRERLDGLMTTAQVIISVAAVLSGQLLPRLVFRPGGIAVFDEKSWWIALLPPAWFAGFDDALAGNKARGSWVLASFAAIATATVLWIAFGKLARDYEAGLQKLGQAATKRRSRGGRRRLIERLVDVPPLRWWLRDSVARASFLLTSAYLLRDRDVKLRLYPAMAPYLVMPIMFLAPGFRTGTNFISGFGISFTGAFLCMIPMMGLNLLQYSQQWQASDVFLAAPMNGPGRLCHGARRAVLFLVALPGFVVVVVTIWLLSRGQRSEVLLLLPGIISLPVFAIIPNIGGHGVPLSVPVEEAKAAGQGVRMIGAMFVSMALSGIAYWGWLAGWFWWFLLGEMIASVALYLMLRRSIETAQWVVQD